LALQDSGHLARIFTKGKKASKANAWLLTALLKMAVLSHLVLGGLEAITLQLLQGFSQGRRQTLPGLGVGPLLSLKLLAEPVTASLELGHLLSQGRIGWGLLQLGRLNQALKLDL
jgi:hypothetical protein